VDWGVGDGAVIWGVDRGSFILQNQGQLRMGSDFPGLTDGLLHALRIIIAQSACKL
jgi:hypothetical protein